MYKPNYKIENKLWRRGFERIAGLDEAGRGAWAGPVVAAAVILPPKLALRGLRDSKQLSPKAREQFYVYINKNAIGIGIGIVSEKVIDEKGIIFATRQAFLDAIENLKLNPDYLLIDGIRLFNHKLPLDFLVKGDNKCVSIAAASVIAKVARDNILIDYNKKYPQYGFDQHKGYGTWEHRSRILDHGACPIHRLSFKPLVEAGYKEL